MENDKISQRMRLTVFAVQVLHDETQSARRGQPRLPYLSLCVRSIGRAWECLKLWEGQGLLTSETAASRGPGYLASG